MLKTFIKSFAILFLTLHSQAGTLDKQSAGLRYTDNVYLEPEGEKSDVYLLINSRANFYPEGRNLIFRLDVADYSRESSNDYLNLILTSRSQTHMDSSYQASILVLKAFHKNYYNGDTAVSDTSFTHTGVGAELEKELLSRTSLSVLGNVGYEGRFFHKFSGRHDHQFSANVDLDFTGNTRVTPYIYSGLGLVLSSEAAYTTTFYDLGGGAKGLLTRDWSWLADLGVRSTRYVNRTIDQVTEVSRARGNRIVTLKEKEQTSCVTTSLGLDWNMQKNWNFESRINISSQSSNNPNFVYQNNEIIFTLSYRP